jgi:hypothetical protein
MASLETDMQSRTLARTYFARSVVFRLLAP